MVRGQGRGFVASVAAACIALAANPAWAGSYSLFGAQGDYKLTLGYAAAIRMEKQSQDLINGPVDQMQIAFTPAASATCPAPPCIGSFQHTGLPITTNFDDGDRDFAKNNWLNNRYSIYGETEIKLDNLGLGDIGLVGSGAAHYDHVYLGSNDHDNPASVNRVGVDSNGDRYGPVSTWLDEAQHVNGKRKRLLEAYAYGQWSLSDTMALSLRLGRHLAAWGESLFFPGIASAQGPFDATKANVPGVEVKEILLPVNQVSMQLQLTSEMTALAYKQFEFQETEIYPEGDFFSPADLVGPGATFGYGSINPVSPKHCNDPTVTDSTTGQPAPPGSLCQAAGAFENQPEYIMTLRTPDQVPGTNKQWGVGLKYAITPNFNLGGYYIRYNNHNPNVVLNMGYARVGDAAGSCSNGPGSSGCQPVTTQAFNVRVPVSYTVDYADNVEMRAISFSTVFWVFNIGGEITQRKNVDTSLEASIAGVDAPVGTRGDTTTAQASFLYVNNPGFVYDEVVVVTEIGYTQVDKTKPRQNEDGICMTGSDQSDCQPGKTSYASSGNTLFYDKSSEAMQMLVLPKIRNAFPGWDIGTPLNFAWLISGTPSTPGVFGALYGEGDMRVGLGVTAQYVQNFEINLTYNAFLGDTKKLIGNSTLHANPYVDRDYLALSLKYNL